MSVLADVRLCLAFFTRLPVRSVEARPLASAIWAAPVAGVAVGCVAGLVLAIAAGLGASASVAAALALAATSLATGALHEDGLADTADGFGGGATRERKLAIMRDSRIGSYGVVALVLSYLLRWSALTAIIMQGGTEHAVLALIAAHGASRATLALVMRWLPLARDSGLAASAGAPSANTVALSLGLGGALLLLIWPQAVTAIALLALVVALAGLMARHHIGGYTGDLLGALQQAGETAVLIAASLAV